MWKTIAKFVSEPVYHEVQFMKFYKATLKNKDGNFNCSFGEKYLQDYSAEKKVCFLKGKKTNFGFSCQGIEFLDNDHELTSWEETTKQKDSKISKEELQQEIQEKLKIVSELLKKETGNSWSFWVEKKPFFVYLECANKPHLKFGITDAPKNEVKIDNNSALNHLKNIYVDLANIDIYNLLKTIQERIKLLEKLSSAMLI